MRADYKEHDNSDGQRADQCSESQGTRSQQPWRQQIERHLRAERPTDLRSEREETEILIGVVRERNEPIRSEQEDRTEDAQRRLVQPRGGHRHGGKYHHGPPQRINAQEARFVELISSRFCPWILGIQDIAHQETADDVEEYHGAAADDVQRPTGVAGNLKISCSVAFMAEHDAIGEEQSNCPHAQAPVQCHAECRAKLTGKRIHVNGARRGSHAFETTCRTRKGCRQRIQGIA